MVIQAVIRIDIATNYIIWIKRITAYAWKRRNIVFTCFEVVSPSRASVLIVSNFDFSLKRRSFNHLFPSRLKIVIGIGVSRTRSRPTDQNFNIFVGIIPVFVVRCGQFLISRLNKSFRLRHIASAQSFIGIVGRITRNGSRSVRPSTVFGFSIAVSSQKTFLGLLCISVNTAVINIIIVLRVQNTVCRLIGSEYVCCKLTSVQSKRHRLFKLGNS